MNPKKYLISAKLPKLNIDPKTSFLLSRSLATYGKKELNTLNHPIFTHPWDKYSNLEKDSKKIFTLYENCLTILSSNLNKHFKKNYSKRFWRILIGYWLHVIICIYYEKKILIKKNLKNKKIYFVKYKLNKKNYIAKDGLDFVIKTSTDQWQYYFFLSLVQDTSYKKKIIFKKKNQFLNCPKDKSFKKPNNSIILALLKIFSFFKKRQKIFFFKTYVGRNRRLILSLKNFDWLPNIFKNNTSAPKYNLKDRLNFLSNIDVKNNEYKKIFSLLIHNLPLSFFEGFNQVGKDIKDSFLPESPKVIFSSNIIQGSSYEARYVAEMVEKNSKLILGQHGGNYNTLHNFFPQEHEIKCSDFFISWGWKSKNKKVKNFGFFLDEKKINKDYKNKKINILLVTNQMNRFVTSLSAGIHYPTFKYNHYYKFFPLFLKKIDKTIAEKITIRSVEKPAHIPIPSWNFQDFILEQFPKVLFSYKKGKVYDLINESKLVINSIFMTIFCECMAANKPNILVQFSTDNFKSYNLETQKILNELKKVHIFFPKISSATDFINRNINNIDGWWYNKKTQSVIRKFNRIYAKKNTFLVDDINNLIKKIYD